MAKIPDKKPESYAYFFMQLLLQTNTAQRQPTSTEPLRSSVHYKFQRFSETPG